MGQQLRKRLKRQRRDARNKRVQARLRAGMKKYFLGAMAEWLGRALQKLV
jgi:hypothetical protein